MGNGDQGTSKIKDLGISCGKISNPMLVLPSVGKCKQCARALPAWVLAHVVNISADPRLRDCHYKPSLTNPAYGPWLPLRRWIRDVVIPEIP